MQIKGGRTEYLAKIAKINEIETKENNKKVVSVTIYSWVSKNHKFVWSPIELSFWDKDAEKISQYPVGTPIRVKGVQSVNMFIKKDGEADCSFTMDVYEWETSEAEPSSTAKKPTPPSPAPLPDILKEVMNAGKYKGKGLIYAEVLSQDRQYINDLILNEKTPEAWKLKLIEISKAYDDWMAKNQHG